MPCSSMVERSAVNGVVVGSSPTGAVYKCRRLTLELRKPSLALFWSNKNDALWPHSIMVSISGFHPEDWSSILHGAIIGVV